MPRIIQLDREKLTGAIWGKRAEVAQKMGLHEVSLSRKVHGHQPLKLDELNQIALALNRDVDDFFDLVENNEKQRESQSFGGKVVEELTLQERRNFMELPIEERKRIMEEQAEEIKEYYEQDTEWEERQGGEIVEY